MGLGSVNKKFGARAVKYKLGARAGKHKLGAKARTEGQAEDRGPGSTNTPFILCFVELRRKVIFQRLIIVAALVYIKKSFYSIKTTLLSVATVVLMLISFFRKFQI